MNHRAGEPAAELALALEPHRQALMQATEALREQRVDFAEVLIALRQMVRGPEPVAVTPPEVLQELEDLRIQNQQLVALFQEREAQPPPLGPEVAQQLDELRAENRRLTELLQEMDQARAEQNAEPPAESVDLESYEAELNRFRQQLQADRQKLNAEMQQLRVRNQELDDATRDMEMEFSRERAELARERTRLERLREDVRCDLERVQRDAGVRESLASVHRLREGFSQHK
jgi:chromosome segregation ATPase